MPSITFSALDGLVALARLGRSAPRLEDFLAGVAETAAATLGFRTAAFNLYRPADDDFVTTCVTGSEPGHEALVGTSSPGAWWRRLFAEAVEIERVFFFPAGSVDWNAADVPAHAPMVAPSTDHADRWEPQDALVAPLVSSSGETLGFLSLDDPIDGRRPSTRRLKALAAVAAQAAVTVEQRQAERAAVAHSASLTHLVGAAASLGGVADEQAVVDTLTHVLRTALGFEHVVATYGEALTADAAAVIAAVGSHVDDQDGAYLLSPAMVERFCPSWQPPRSTGEGARSWGGHLLLLPLERTDGRLAGVIRLAEPEHRLLPDEDGFALLGLLGAQAEAALENVAQQGLRTQRDTAVHLARHDEFTGLPNRRALATAIDQRHASHAVSTLLAIGLDEFAIVREAFGHDHAEATRGAVAERVATLAPTSAALYHLDGDVLGVLVDGTVRDAMRFSDAVRLALTDPFAVAGTEHRLGATIGIAAVAADSAETVRRADVARLHARRERNLAAVYDAAIDDAARRLARVAALREAPERGELELHFQPIVDARTRQIAALEALVRWRHDGRLIPPLEFIGVAESSGLIARIGAWVIDAAAAQARAWRDAGISVPPVTVNVAPLQLRSGQLASTIAESLERYRLPATALVAEITESGLQPDARVNAELDALRELGVRTAVDDFGADYSSLGRLRELPVSILKVDRAFLRDVPHDARAIDLVHAIMSLGSALGMEVVVEGVETGEQAALLAAAPTRVLWQGYLTSRPLPADDIAPRLRAGR
ncbi:MAG: GGDEF domain-containing protein [Solirubrobacteraceae bacterium]|nr:GGDEF domain-containing protein [Solirubrobacteraceae bacterium]